MSYSMKICLFLALIGYSTLVSGEFGRISGEEALKICTARSGLELSDIKDHYVRNENCAVDCITRQGTMMSYYVEDGDKCHMNQDYKCILGKCRSSFDSPPDAEGLYSVEIFVKSASVPDMDPSPLAGESDVFVVVETAEDSGPSYSDDEIICHTHVIQDNNKPKWKKFSCKPMPMKLSTRLRFKAIDSDKPFETHDVLGETGETIEMLMNNGARKMPLIRGNKLAYDSNYWVEIEVKGKAYKLD